MRGRHRNLRLALGALIVGSSLGLLAAPSQAQDAEPADIEVALVVTPASRPVPGGQFLYTVAVRNNYGVAANVSDLTDLVNGDLLDPNNPEITDNTCLGFGPIPSGDLATCSYRALFESNVPAAQTTSIRVEGRNDRRIEFTEFSDRETIRITDRVIEPPAERTDIVTNASPDITLGGTVHDTARLVNAINDNGTITFRLYGPNDADCDTAPVFTSSIPTDDGTARSDSFRPVAPGTYRWIATFNSTGRPISSVSGECNDPDETVVVIDERFPELDDDISVVKTATPGSRPAPGGAFTFIIEVTNNTRGDVTLYELNDSVHGNLDGRGTCDLQQIIDPGDSYTCQFTAEFFGNAGDSEIDVVTARAVGRGGRELVDRDDAEIFLTREDDRRVTTGGTTGGGTTGGGTTGGGSTTGGTTTGGTTTGGTVTGGTTTPATVLPNTIVRTGANSRLTFLWSVLFLSVGGMFLATGMDLRARRRHS